MLPLIEGLYHMAAENWGAAMGLLDRDEYVEYQLCCRFCEEQTERQAQRLTGDELAVWNRYLANLEQTRDAECRLCFARGLAAGLALGGLAAGEWGRVPNPPGPDRVRRLNEPSA